MPSFAPKEKNQLLMKWETLARRKEASVLPAGGRVQNKGLLCQGLQKTDLGCSLRILEQQLLQGPVIDSIATWDKSCNCYWFLYPHL